MQAAALEHLPYFDDPRAFDALAHALEAGRPRARAAAAQALGVIPGAAAQDLLRRAIGDEEPWVRYFAAMSIGRLGDASTLDVLEEAARSDPAPQVAVAAVEAVGAIGGDDAVRILSP